MKKKIFLLPCIAAVAIATFVGAKSFKTNAYESNELLLANVEAMSKQEITGTLISCCRKGGGTRGDYAYVCRPGTTFLNSTTDSPDGATVKDCTGPKQIPKLSLGDNNWGYCLEY